MKIVKNPIPCRPRTLQRCGRRICEKKYSNNFNGQKLVGLIAFRCNSAILLMDPALRVRQEALERFVTSGALGLLRPLCRRSNMHSLVAAREAAGRAWTFYAGLAEPNC